MNTPTLWTPTHPQASTPRSHHPPPSTPTPTLWTPTLPVRTRTFHYPDQASTESSHQLTPSTRTLWTQTLLWSLLTLTLWNPTHWLFGLTLLIRGPMPPNLHHFRGSVLPLRVCLKIWHPLLIHHRKMDSVLLLLLMVGSLVRSPWTLRLTMVLILPLF